MVEKSTVQIKDFQRILQPSVVLVIRQRTQTEYLIMQRNCT